MTVYLSISQHEQARYFLLALLIIKQITILVIQQLSSICRSSIYAVSMYHVVRRLSKQVIELTVIRAICRPFCSTTDTGTYCWVARCNGWICNVCWWGAWTPAAPTIICFGEFRQALTCGGHRIEQSCVWGAPCCALCDACGPVNGRYSAVAGWYSAAAAAAWAAAWWRILRWHVASITWNDEQTDWSYCHYDFGQKYGLCISPSAIGSNEISGTLYINAHIEVFIIVAVHSK